MIPFNGERKINWAVMVRRKQSASVMEGYTELNLSLSLCFSYSASLSLLYTVTDNGLLKDPEEDDSVWWSVARACHLCTAHSEEYTAINLHHVRLCLTLPSLTCQLLGGVSPLPPWHIIHSRINWGTNSMNKWEYTVREVKRQAKHTFSGQ